MYVCMYAELCSSSSKSVRIVHYSLVVYFVYHIQVVPSLQMLNIKMITVLNLLHFLCILFLHCQLRRMKKHQIKQPET